MTVPIFRDCTPEDVAAVIDMMRLLYEEDPSGAVSPAHFRRTVDELTSHPDHGRIVVFDAPGAPRVGYAIVVPYWSNEFGGTMAWIDEVYVRAPFRSRGIGRAFFAWAERERAFDAVVMALEVTPRNERAMAFYRGMGFVERTNRMLVKSVEA